MELDLGPEIAEFRAELRDWIAAEAPPALPGLADWNMPVTAGGRTHAKLAAAEAHPAYAEWEAKLAGQRLICPQWPEEFGGKGIDAVRGAVLNEEFYRAGVPRVTRGMGEWLVGPSIMVHGTPEMIRGRKYARCSGVACTMMDGPTSHSPMPRVTRGTPAR